MYCCHGPPLMTHRWVFFMWTPGGPMHSLLHHLIPPLLLQLPNRKPCSGISLIHLSPQPMLGKTSRAQHHVTTNLLIGLCSFLCLEHPLSSEPGLCVFSDLTLHSPGSWLCPPSLQDQNSDLVWMCIPSESSARLGLHKPTDCPTMKTGTIYN